MSKQDRQQRDRDEVHERGKDAEGVGALRVPEFMVGYVDEIHGAGGDEFPTFPITRAELITLAKNWLRTDLDVELEAYWTGSGISRSERMLSIYACRRLARITALLGTEAIDAVIEKLTAEVRREHGDDFWEAFRQRDSQFQQKLCEESDELVTHFDVMRQDKETQDAVFEYLRNNPEGYQIDRAGDLWTLAPSLDNAARLVLRVTTSKGVSHRFTDRAIDRPARWHAPFGIR
jgi:hypothetical protein